MSEVKGKDIVELIAAGKEKLASVPSGGGGAVAVAAAPGGGGGGAAPAAEVKKEEKVEEKEESDDVSVSFPPLPHNGQNQNWFYFQSNVIVVEVLYVWLLLGKIDFASNFWFD